MAAIIEHVPVVNRRKRKRRRRQDKSAIFARLVLDEHVKGDVGIVSEDLFTELFPPVQQSQANREKPANIPEFHHIAISPKAPFTSVDEISWTIVPIRASSALANSTIQFSPSSTALQGFAEELQRTTPSKLLNHSKSGIEVWALDVLPLTLDTVFVTLESDLAKRLENGEGTFHGEHPQANGLKKGVATANPEDQLTSALREALSSLKVVHTGDFFPLPLAPHPITHVPPPPAKVTLCEPVAQGILSPNTKIIVTQTHHHSRVARKASIPIKRVLDQVSEIDEDTGNEQFFSAAEDRYKTDAPVDESMTETETEAELTENDDLSDDSMDDMISLQAPILHSANASGMATIQPGTPGTIGPGGRMSGIRSPGSVFSNFTATTARAGGQRGRLFKAQGLLRPLPEELLRPVPSPEEDEEARIYVDVNSLTKIGCFSGDWVRLETASEPPPTGMGLWSLGNFGKAVEEDFIWRPVKVYSLPEGYSHRSVTKIPNKGGRRLSFFESQVSKPSNPTVYLSPILLANLDSPPYLRLSTLKAAPTFGRVPSKITSSSHPPVAREITLLKVATPLATERSLQTASLGGLKRHFAQRTRVTKIGDLVGVPIDETLGRTMFQPASKDDIIIDEMLASTGPQASSISKTTGIVWFKVGHITPAKTENGGISEEEDIWGGVASIDAASTQMVQAGTETGRLPGTKDSSWEYYLNLRAVSKPSNETVTSALPEPRPQHVSAIRRRLRELIAAATSSRAIHLKLPPVAILIVSTQRNIGKVTVATRACWDIGLHSFAIDAYDIVSEGGAGGGDVKTEGFLKARAERALTCGAENTALVIRHIEALAADRMMTALKEILEDSRVLIATTTEVDKVPDGVRGLFTHELEMNAPDEGEREGILRTIVEDQGLALASDVDLGAVAVKTAALVAGDLVDVVERALVARQTRLEELAQKATDQESAITVRDIQVSGGPSGRALIKADFDVAVEAARKNFADAIGAPKIPNVTWDDVGGLSNVKDAVMETIQLPLERPELFAKGMKKRSGILFYGPPGTGKTLLAKAIATEFSLNFFSVKGPELLNMYIGESEANVRRVFQRARDARPCVVFFDELDSVAPKRGNQGDSGGVMDRIVSQLLAELDGMSDGEDGGGGVFVIGATNRPDLLDAALLRPGRFDKMLYLGVSDTHEKQATIMEALTRKFTLSPTLSLSRIASRLPFTYTGADFYALCSDAMLKAVTRQASAVDAKVAMLNSSLSSSPPPESNTPLKITPAYFFDHYATKEDIAVMVTEEDFLEAHRELIPSVSAKELEHYGKVRAQFESVPEKEGKSRPGEANTNTNGSAGPGMPKLSMAQGKGKGKELNGTGITGPGAGTGNGNGNAAIPEWQLPRRPKVNGRPKGKGKGKVRDWGADIGEEDEEEDEPGEEDGFLEDVKVEGFGNGTGNNGFALGRVEDDEGLY